MLRHERRISKLGFKLIAGVDEVGRGSVAGPVVAAALILKDIVFEARIDDSKRLTPHSRIVAYNEIIKKEYA